MTAIFLFFFNLIFRLVPVSIEHCYIVLAPDFPVARFIKYSSLHTNKLQSCFTNLAKVDVCETKESKKMEYHFRPHMVSTAVSLAFFQLIIFIFDLCTLANFIRQGECVITVLQLFRLCF